MLNSFASREKKKIQLLLGSSNAQFLLSPCFSCWFRHCWTHVSELPPGQQRLQSAQLWCLAQAGLGYIGHSCSSDNRPAWTQILVIPETASLTVTSPYAAVAAGDSFNRKRVQDCSQHVKWSYKRKLEHLYLPRFKALLYVKTFLLQNWQIKPSSGRSFD